MKGGLGLSHREAPSCPLPSLLPPPSTRRWGGRDGTEGGCPPGDGNIWEASFRGERTWDPIPLSSPGQGRDGP